MDNFVSKSLSEQENRKALMVFARQLILERSNLRLWLATGFLYSALLVCFFQVDNGRKNESLTEWFFILFLVVGWLQYAIVQAMHEATHQVRKADRLQYFAADLLLFYAVGLKPSYRQIHMEHHKYLGSIAQDPDAVVYSRFPHSKLQLMSNLLLNFIGLMAVLQLVRQHLNLRYKNTSETVVKSTQSNNELSQLIILCVVQLLILAAFSWYLSWLDYVLFWLLPLFTVVKTLSYIRVLAEHGDIKRVYALRSFSSSWAARYVWGPFGFAFHAEHHWFVNVPYYKLAKLSAKIEASGLSPRIGQKLEYCENSHIHLIYQWFCQLPWRRSKQL